MDAVTASGARQHMTPASECITVMDAVTASGTDPGVLQLHFVTDVEAPQRLREPLQLIAVEVQQIIDGEAGRQCRRIAVHRG